MHTIRSIKDLAQYLNLSKTTVSFVLNGLGDVKGISKDTQERIIEVARLCNYRPNQLARNLSKGKTKMIGFLAPDLSDPFYARIFHQVTNLLYEEGYSVIGLSSDEKEEKEEQLVQWMLQHRVDGLILASCRRSALPEFQLLLNRIPVVLFDREPDGLQFPRIVVPNEQSALILTEKLIQKGHRKIGLLYVNPWLSTIHSRIQGFRTALDRNGLSHLQEWEAQIDVHKMDQQMGHVLEGFFRGADKPTAIVVLNNVLGSSLVQYLMRSGQKQIHVACFDHLEWFDYAPVPMISVQQPLDQIARECIKSIMGLLQGEQPEALTCLPTQINN